MLTHIRPPLSMLAILTALTGLAYPLAMTGLAEVLIPRTAEGSLIERDGHIVGSALIGQAFTDAAYLQPRPSATGYNAAASGATNLAPSNAKLVADVAARTRAFARDNGVAPPIDAVTSSASGLDPDVSPENALSQAARIAEARGVDPAAVRRLIANQVRGRWLGIFGQQRINVLAFNLALDADLPGAPNRSGI